jgi:outer membrane protein
VTLFAKAILTASLIAPLGLFAQRLKIGHVNTEIIFDSMPEMKTAKKKIDSIGKVYNLELQQLEYQFQMAKNRNDEVSMHELKLRIGFLKVDIDSEIAVKSDEIFKPIRDKVSEAIHEVAIEGKYKLILDSRYDAIILYASKRSDLTQVVEKKLGL